MRGRIFASPRPAAAKRPAASLPGPRRPGRPAAPSGGQIADSAERSIRGLSGGRRLAPGERSFFEPRLEADLGEVRVHTGPEAEQLAAAVGARAFTYGRDVVFGRGEYAPASPAGRRLMAHELVHTRQQTGRGGPIRRQHLPDTGWRFTPPGTVSRSIEEIQGIVGTTPDGVYGINTRRAVERYQGVLRARRLYSGTVNGEWGTSTDVAHDAFATVPNARLRDYNCSGFAFKTFTNVGHADTQVAYTAMSQLSSCGDRCSPFEHKFWMWEFDMYVSQGGARSRSWRDFHTVGGQTDRNGAGPAHVMSKNGGRPLEGPGQPSDFRPVTRTAVWLDGRERPGRMWNVSNVDEQCYCNPSLPGR